MDEHGFYTEGGELLRQDRVRRGNDRDKICEGEEVLNEADCNPARLWVIAAHPVAKKERGKPLV
jgi:hypothetical protein